MFKLIFVWVCVCLSGLRLDYKKGIGNESKCMILFVLNKIINGEGLGIFIYCK